MVCQHQVIFELTARRSEEKRIARWVPGRSIKIPGFSDHVGVGAPYFLGIEQEEPCRRVFKAGPNCQGVSTGPPAPEDRGTGQEESAATRLIDVNPEEFEFPFLLAEDQEIAIVGGPFEVRRAAVFKLPGLPDLHSVLVEDIDLTPGPVHVPSVDVVVELISVVGVLLHRKDHGVVVDVLGVAIDHRHSESGDVVRQGVLFFFRRPAFGREIRKVFLDVLPRIAIPTLLFVEGGEKAEDRNTLTIG
jgi:hypothetical protein